MSMFLAIKELATESQLAKLGAKVNDVILSIGDINTRTNAEFSKAIFAIKSSGNSIVDLTIARGEKLLKLKVDTSQKLGVVCDNQQVSGFDWIGEYTETTETAHKDNVSELEAAKSTRKKFRLFGLGIGFSVGFLPLLSEGLVAAVAIGVFFALVGYVVAEISRHFLKNQRNMPNLQQEGKADTENATNAEANSSSALSGGQIALGLFTAVAVIAYQAGAFSSIFGGFSMIATAEEILKQHLKAPSSYSRHAADVRWEGTDKSGNPAYVVRIEYDATNPMGANLRDCKLIAYAVKGEQYSFVPHVGIESCGGIFGISEDKMIEMLAKANFHQ